MSSPVFKRQLKSVEDAQRYIWEHTKDMGASEAYTHISRTLGAWRYEAHRCEGEDRTQALYRLVAARNMLGLASEQAEVDAYRPGVVSARAWPEERRRRAVVAEHAARYGQEAAERRAEREAENLWHTWSDAFSEPHPEQRRERRRVAQEFHDQPLPTDFEERERELPRRTARPTKASGPPFWEKERRSGPITEWLEHHPAGVEWPAYRSPPTMCSSRTIPNMVRIANSDFCDDFYRTR